VKRPLSSTFTQQNSVCITYSPHSRFTSESLQVCTFQYCNIISLLEKITKFIFVLYIYVYIYSKLTVTDISAFYSSQNLRIILIYVSVLTFAAPSYDSLLTGVYYNDFVRLDFVTFSKYSDKKLSFSQANLNFNEILLTCILLTCLIKNFVNASWKVQSLSP
jgi:hypothetical protein